MTARLARLQRVEAARRQLLAIEVARRAQLDRKLLDLREQRDVLGAQFGGTSRALSRHFGLLYEKINRALRAAETARDTNRLDVLRQKQELEAWHDMVEGERSLRLKAREQAELSEIIDAMLAVASFASLR